MSQEVADRFAEALRKLEEDRDAEPLVGIHTEDYDVGNVAVPETLTATRSAGYAPISTLAA